VKKRNNLKSVVLGAAIMSSSAFAGINGSCGAGKCGAGKCGGNMKAKKVEVNSKDTMSGSKGTKSNASCGSGMKDKKSKEAMSDANKTKASASCGTGKCGSM